MILSARPAAGENDDNRYAERRVSPGMSVLQVGPLDAEAAAELIGRRSGVAVARSVAVTLSTAAEGNPLALAELAGLLTADHLRGRVALPDPLPIGEGMERAFRAQIRAQPADTREALLLAAAEGTALTAVHALEAAEAAGLLRVRDGRLEFRHPLIRSAVYRDASDARRRAAHRALADRLTDPDRRAWHLGAATLGADDAVAGLLAASAVRARRRSAPAAAAAAHRRAAQLSTDPLVRARRLVDGAEDAWLAGQSRAAYAGLDEAEGLVADEPLGDRIAHLRGRFELRRGTAGEAYRILLARGTAAARRDPATALAMLAEAADAASLVGDVAGIAAAGNAARDVPPTGDPDAEFWRDLTAGVADALQGRPEQAAPRLAAVLAGTDRLTDPYMLHQAGVAAVYLGDGAAAERLLLAAVRQARDSGMVGDLPYVLVNVAALEQAKGRYATVRAISEEGLRLAEEIGQDSARCMHLATLAVVAAIQGDEAACRSRVDRTLELATPRGLGLPIARAGLALALHDLGAGRYPQAAARFAGLFGAPPGAGHPGVVLAVLPEWIEASIRAGDLDQARRTLGLLESLTAHADDSARAAVLCCRALLGEDADALFTEALAVQAATGTAVPFVARTHLLFGEWLRRNRQRTRSRTHLRAAMEAFERLGAAPWAARARAELRASGETSRRRDETTTEPLTPQELRIAQSVAQGQSTRDVAAALFLSPRTVEYHLYKIFPKLGVTSRAQLIKLVTENPDLVDVR